MLKARPNIPLTAEIRNILARAVALDPLADIESDIEAICNKRLTLFGVMAGEEVKGAFMGSIGRKAGLDELKIFAAAARDESERLTLATLAEFDRLAREASCRAVRAEIYNPRLMPILRRKGYRPLCVTMRKEI